MASKLLTTFKRKITGLELEPSDGGCFELSVDGKLVFSKLQTGDFPDEDSIVQQVGKHV